ncbi:MAG TPA: ABC transporter permease [Steroidobacteraceae bacterium]|nr:ABC transporter permease [Steroidobacteraceae bacterium]
MRQFLALLRMNLAGEGARLGSVLTIVTGVTCTVAVLVSMLAMGTGAHRQAVGDVHDDEVIVQARGSQILQSSITRDEMVTVRDLPGLARDKDGEPHVDGIVVVPFEGHRRGSGRRVFFPLLGTTDPNFELRPPAHLTAGRFFRPGLHEIIATNACVGQFDGFELGARREVRGVAWTVVGHYDQGQSLQCIVLTDAETLMSLFGRNGYNRINVRLEAPSSFETFNRALEGNPSLKLEAKPEREQSEADMKQFNGLLNFVSYFIGSIMAIGATFGAVNSLYSIVDARRRELATLRAIGFGSGAIVAATLVESVLLALPGALLGAALAWLLFHGMAVSPFGFPFKLDVTPRLAEIGIAWALVMGFIGGLLPSLRAARVPVTTALRAT